jgi:thermitase
MKTRLLGAVFVLVSILGFSRAESGGQEYIVTLSSGASISALNRAHRTRTIAQIPNTSIYLIKTDDDDSDDKILKHLQHDKSVQSVEKNARIKLHSDQQAPLDSALADAMASLLDGHTLDTFYGTNVLRSYIDQPALRLTRVNDVRDISTGAGTRVAYIDTGVDPYHPALRPWLDPGVDLLNNRSTSELDGLSDAMASLLDDAMASLLDRRFLFLLDDAMASLLDGENSGHVFPSAWGHGTLVAGVIHVVAPNARIVPIKAFDAYGHTTMFTIVEGVYSATNLDADVLNMSFSTPEYSVTLRKAIADARAAGIVVVASVGNDGHNVDAIYPASYPGVIGVAATDFNDHIASFSNYGKSVSVVATGAFVISTVPGGRYAAAWGTSFSAPIVSGAIALRASMRGHGHSDSSLVINTADSIDFLNPGFEGQLGKGRVNVRRALKNGN